MRVKRKNMRERERGREEEKIKIKKPRKKGMTRNVSNIFEAN